MGGRSGLGYHKGSVSGVKVRSLPVASRHSAQGNPGSQALGISVKYLRRGCVDTRRLWRLLDKVPFSVGRQGVFWQIGHVRLEESQPWKDMSGQVRAYKTAIDSVSIQDLLYHFQLNLQ